jgi:hypothetical protein
MRSIVIIFIIIILGYIFAAGCVGQIKDTPVNTTISPSNTFTPLINITNVSNTSNITPTSGLKGTLRVSIGGWTTDLPVFIDDKSVGYVTHDKPLDLMLDEGNHTVKVCAGICKEEVVTIQFAKLRFVNFEEWLVKEVKYPKPIAQMVSYYTSGDQITVSVEFINPSSEDISMSAEIKCGYSYIDPRSNNRIGGVAQGIANADVESGTSEIETVYLYLADGWSYIYNIPEISKITFR